MYLPHIPPYTSPNVSFSELCEKAEKKAAQIRKEARAKDAKKKQAEEAERKRKEEAAAAALAKAQAEAQTQQSEGGDAAQAGGEAGAAQAEHTEL